MRAMRLIAPRSSLTFQEVPIPEPLEHQVLIKVAACGVCRTDLHLLDGELPRISYPITPGHEIVGRVARCGEQVTMLHPGDRVGVPWLGYTCGSCFYCRRGAENLCECAGFTGYTLDGGYAEYVAADSRYCLKIPDQYTDIDAAPLLCAGLIGYRAYRAAGSARNLGLYGFGAAAHLLTQLATQESRRVYAFVREGDLVGQRFALSLGAAWAGASTEHAPELLDAAIIFAPVGSLVPTALKATRPGGRVVCAGIHMSEIPAFPYALLWGERSVCSVANLTRADGADFMGIASHTKLQPTVQAFTLAQANVALSKLRAGTLAGCAVLRVLD
ncbi:MAG: zinc-dependent alcohol dehydrogenase family protein [Proteobacteria bacterium]|nr:zinc-dependent alcohol dehydrogenase family protein [Pseudomonadota bacterium]